MNGITFKLLKSLQELTPEELEEYIRAIVQDEIRRNSFIECKGFWLTTDDKKYF